MVGVAGADELGVVVLLWLSSGADPAVSPHRPVVKI